MSARAQLPSAAVGECYHSNSSRFCIGGEAGGRLTVQEQQMSYAVNFSDSENEDDKDNDILRLSRLIGKANVCGLLSGVAAACRMVHPDNQLAPIAECVMLRLIEFIVESVVAAVPSESAVDVIQLDDIKRGFEAFLKPDTGLSAYALHEIDAAVCRCESSQASIIPFRICPPTLGHRTPILRPIHWKSMPE
jgi:hypothetical protein